MRPVSDVAREYRERAGDMPPSTKSGSHSFTPIPGAGSASLFENNAVMEDAVDEDLEDVSREVDEIEAFNLTLPRLPEEDVALDMDEIEIEGDSREEESTDDEDGRYDEGSESEESDEGGEYE
ncbi:hypothetical protein NLJ89_g2357 [Agrocybe chaxingu]|uniref:Uncharacterized protein n=1 Tax=Agrocybe chaxingu TaxID=84603 RepID=A0A9W8K6R9_9AGAR|nr:hypothetical protein NLJ89_g2357 [Agrocybe chaxingu]